MRPPTHIREIREVEIRSIRREQDRLDRIMGSLGYEELEKPIRHGWYMFPVLREDIANRQDAEVFQEVIDACGVTVWGRTKKRARAELDRRVRFPGFFRSPGIDEIYEKKYNELSLRAKKYFDGPYGYSFSPKYRCTVPGFFYVSKFKRAYITHRKIIDHAIRQRMDELEGMLWRKGYFKQVYGWAGVSKWKRKRDQQKIRRDGRRQVQRYVKGEVEEVISLYKNPKGYF